MNKYIGVTFILLFGIFNHSVAQTHVQTRARVQNSTATTISRSFSAASTSGNLIVVHLDWDGQTRSITTVTDNKGNSYARISGPTNWDGITSRAELWYAYNITGGGTAITVTATLSGAPTSFSQIFISEYSGIITGNPLNKSAVAIGNAATASSGSVITTYTNELIYGAGLASSSNLSAGVGFTDRLAFNNDDIEDKKVATVGAYSADFISSGGNWISQMATFISTSSSIILPIDLLSFTGRSNNNTILLEWSTASETNNDYFTIQRSTEGISWENIEKVPAVGTSSITQFYSAKDPSPYAGHSYYRLKQTDIDGKSTYSFIVSITLGNKLSEMTIYPNPAQNLVKIKFPVPGNYEVEVINGNGQLMVQPVLINGGNAELNVSELKTGVYFIHIGHDGTNEIRKILISK